MSNKSAARHFLSGLIETEETTREKENERECCPTLNGRSPSSFLRVTALRCLSEGDVM